MRQWQKENERNVEKIRNMKYVVNTKLISCRNLRCSNIKYKNYLPGQRNRNP